MNKISILMPAYNAEKYVSIAIDSVIAQSYQDWELIIIDDNSTDATGFICDEYSRKEGRIKTYHMTENVGISNAKNEAITKSTGEYIAFCDDDDLMDPNTLRDNVRLVEQYRPDIVRWSYKTIKVDELGKEYQTIECKCKDGVYLSRKDIFDNYSNVHTMLSCDWTALYKKSIIDTNDVLFNRKFRYGGEDTLFNLELLDYAKSMVMNEGCYYNWYLRKNHSTTAKRNINFCDSMMEVAQKERRLLEENCPDYKNIWPQYREFYTNLICNYAEKLPKNEADRIREAVCVL